MTTFDPERITYFAETDARGRNVPFGIRAKDRTRHVYVIGKSGMGKSTTLENMAVQDIKNGEGFAFIDPHGQSAEAILHHIPEHRLNDVLYFNPSDLTNPIAFNVLEGVDTDKRFLVVSGLMSVFKKIWVDAWSARMEYLLQYTLLALLEYPGSTLLGVNRMLSDKGYRDTVVASVTDPGVKAFWEDEYAKYSEKYAQEAGDAIKNKIGQFTSNTIIRNIVGQEHTSFNIREFMDARKILIVNLSKGLIGESNANLLGSMLTTRIYLAAMSRADLSPRDMALAPNFYFYVDEFQSFANATFANILSEARKYKLNLTIAHQYVDQMEEDVRNAVFGNVGTTIAFRVGPLDAEVLEKIFMPEFTATDIVNLGFAQIYLTMMIDGIGSRPFSARTLPPIKEPPVTYRDVVVARSRAQFGSPRAEVEEKIGAYYAREFGDGSAKEKKAGKFGGAGRGDGARGSFPRANPAPRVGPAHIPADEAAQHKEELRAILSGIADQPPKSSVPGPEAPTVATTPVEKQVSAPTREPSAAPTPEFEPRDTFAVASASMPESPPVERGSIRTPRERDGVRERSLERPPRDRSSERRAGYAEDRNRPPRRNRDDAHGDTRREPRERTERTDERPAPKNELKSALAAALAGISVPESTTSSEDARVSPGLAPVRVSLEDATPAPATPSPAPAVRPSAPDQHPHIDVQAMRDHLQDKAEMLARRTRAPHEVSPKALAHMMRITLNDKKKRPSL